MGVLRRNKKPLCICGHNKSTHGYSKNTECMHRRYGMCDCKNYVGDKK